MCLHKPGKYSPGAACASFLRKLLADISRMSTKPCRATSRICSRYSARLLSLSCFAIPSPAGRKHAQPHIGVFRICQNEVPRA